ncbi:agmatine deiminase [Arabiibacter massiliensis]|uniref:agmatine deiminase n=1 Tax=Arabiibacter massiliensis TaxID=1870985 RepID=UPI0009BB0DE6|nr:agmatine deiminase [Arabiibacter massiliensis]
MRTLATTPRQDGFHMPAEFEPHERCWMIWPQRRDTFRYGAKLAQKAFIEFAQAIARFEPVTVCANDDQYEVALRAVGDFAQVVEVSNDDFWMRDTGPTFVTNGRELRGVDWTFNAWGGLFDGLFFPWDKDDRVASKVCSLAGVDRYRLDDFVLEGGSIHVDGEGTLVVTESCLLSPGRNPEMDKQEIEDTLKDYLGVEKVIWLPAGIFLDETNGHVDNVFNFTAPGECLLAWTDDPADPQYELSHACLEVLERETDAKGRALKVRKLHIPDPILLTEEERDGMDQVCEGWPPEAGSRLPASYANYYTANGGIVFPLFDDEVHDAMAAEVLREAYPGREVVGVSCHEMFLGGGNVHCATQQQPAVS